MNFMNTTANIKQLELLRFISKNSDDDYVMSKITVVLRRDKIEAPYYMIVKIKLSSCIDRPDNGLIHAMDVLNHTRRHNLTEDSYNEIKSLIVEGDIESGNVEISQSDKQLKMVLMSRNNEEMENLFKVYADLFDKIDNLVD